VPNQYLPGVITIPSTLLITAITQSYPMVVSVEVGNDSSEANTYIVGMCVRLFIPKSYGMFQANGLTGTILSIVDSSFYIDIDSTNFDAFSVPNEPVAALMQIPASLSPNGSRNLEYNNSTNKVPFQSLNNIGN
jgi:hypothetical protein